MSRFKKILDVDVKMKTKLSVRRLQRWNINEDNNGLIQIDNALFTCTLECNTSGTPYASG